MGYKQQKDFAAFLVALNKVEVRDVAVGGYAVMCRGYNRTAGNFDEWALKTKENHEKKAMRF